MPYKVLTKNILLYIEDDDYGTYKITKKVSPPPITTYNPTKQDNLLKCALKRDIALVLVSAIGNTFVSEGQEICWIMDQFHEKGYASEGVPLNI